MNSFSDVRNERLIIAHYIANGTPPEDRLDAQCFEDALTREILSTVDAVEGEQGAVSSQTILARLNKKDRLSFPLSDYALTLNDPEGTTLSTGIAKTIEDDVRSDFGRRETYRLHVTATQEIEAGEAPVEVHLCYSSGWNDLSTVIESEWLDPLPIIESVEGYRFPVECLPKLIREAVEELDKAVKSPTSLSAFSALSWASLATQHLADVSRDSKEVLTGPTSNFYLTVAESGERKTACDKLLGKEVRKWSGDRIDELEAEINRWQAGHEIWETKKAGVRDALKQKAKKGVSTSEEESELESLQCNEPKPPRIPSLIFENETPQSLRKKLSYTTPKAWLSGALMSSEGGSILSGHAMQGETKLDMLTCWNKQWDGEGTQTGRVGDGDSDTNGSRLTVGISAQPSVVRNFLADGEAVGCGAMARFWLAAPETKMGTRFYEEPDDTPKINAFGKRLLNLLSQLPERDDMGRLVIPMQHLSPEAKKTWASFHDAIEERMKPGDDLGSPEMSAVAAKAMDRAVRLASNFHFIAGGKVGEPISDKAMTDASIITLWNLEEWKRFLGAQSLDPCQRDAIELDKFLISHCRKTKVLKFKDRYVTQYGPRKLRKESERRERAYAWLRELNRIRWNAEKKTIEVNPRLIN